MKEKIKAILNTHSSCSLKDCPEHVIAPLDEIMKVVEK